MGHSEVVCYLQHMYCGNISLEAVHVPVRKDLWRCPVRKDLWRCSCKKGGICGGVPVRREGFVEVFL